MGESARAAPGGVMANGACQPLGTWGLDQVVPMAPSGPTQKTSSAPSNRVMAAMGESARAAPGGVMAKGACQPPGTWGLDQVVLTAPSGPIQKTSSAPSNRVMAAMGEPA